MTTKRLVLGLIFIFALLSGLLWINKHDPELEARRHEEAMAEWPVCVQNGLRDKPSAETFYRCFRVGDPASKYEALFVSAEKTKHDDREWMKSWVEYSWYYPYDFGGEQTGTRHDFRVRVGGEPQVIRDVYICQHGVHPE